jgi:arylsulfatase A-like enzyme
VAAACGPPADAPPDVGWNVLVLVPDTIRADRLSAAGYPRPTTPALDRIAREGVLFTQAITAAPRTWQSFTTILTGLYPPNHGVRFIGDRPLAPGTPSLGSVLTEHGYDTAAFDPMFFLVRLTQIRHFGQYVGASPGAVGNADEVLLGQVAEFVSGERSRPFLAFVRLNGAHWPYNDDRWIDEFESCSGHRHGFNVGGYGLRFGGEGEGPKLSDEEAFRRLIWTADPDEETRRHRIAHYDAEVRAVDEMIGVLLEGMRSTGVLDRTIVLVTSDHGESFFEHGYHQHGPRVDDVVMRVPLVLRLPPGHPEHRAGQRVDSLVRTVDVFPTLLDAVDVPVPEGLDGVSLLPLVRGDASPGLWAYGEVGRSFMGMDPERRLPGVEGKRRMIRTEGWKLVHVPDATGGEDRLYDLGSDPGETEDVAARHPERVASLRALLDPILASERPRRPDRELTPEEIEELRELGYMQ